eukprot:2084140-Amphidinium_carterae.1
MATLASITSLCRVLINIQFINAHAAYNQDAEHHSARILRPGILLCTDKSKGLEGQELRRVLIQTLWFLGLLYHSSISSGTRDDDLWMIQMS